MMAVYAICCAPLNFLGGGTPCAERHPFGEPLVDVQLFPRGLRQGHLHQRVRAEADAVDGVQMLTRRPDLQDDGANRALGETGVVLVHAVEHARPVGVVKAREPEGGTGVAVVFSPDLSVKGNCQGSRQESVRIARGQGRCSKSHQDECEEGFHAATWLAC